MRHLTVPALAAALALTMAVTPAEAAPRRWAAAWGTAAQPATASTSWYGPNWSREGFARQGPETLRQIVRVSTGGTSVRVRLSNVYGTAPLPVDGAAIAAALRGTATSRPRTLTFAGRKGAVVPPGRELLSDPVALPVRPMGRLAVTLRFTRPTGAATFHHFAQATSYRAAGDHLADTAGDAFTDTSDSWYYLTGVEVAAPRGTGAVVAFGDSLTDGVGSTVGADGRYPDRLAERLAGRSLAVVNAGIGGNRLLTDSPEYGENGLARFRRDALDRPGVRTVIIMDGVNDLAEWNKPHQASADRIIDGHRRLVQAAHARGVEVVGATIMPMKGAALAYGPAAEAVRDEVNQWIRTGGAYDHVVDFDAVVRQPDDPDALRPQYDSGDGIHLNDAGYRAIAQAVDLATL
ncbi:SGNH/GDSL hydrolase family protein [Nonomuraea sp. SMC257]|uniref:SGNH/GDSL hydrolase family protein n=1 Tax=Nonomuraea montanisoli TaxID=2741721 RepID=A0A7Y6M7W3_9ACTN|nr:SGNH/GDSL hydrolase family protein [Nonomuraea montanisoli]NUW37922.1 SGNH/GDSL hydrolase family protein [Nonomuraea montanisoli]